MQVTLGVYYTKSTGIGSFLQANNSIGDDMQVKCRSNNGIICPPFVYGVVDTVHLRLEVFFWAVLINYTHRCERL